MTTTNTLGKVLLVDDKDEVRTFLGESLARSGYETQAAASGEEALELLRAQDFDVLLTDLMMPGIDGIALLQAGLEVDPNLVGVIMTGHGTVDTAVDAMKIGAYDYIIKPFDFNTILLVLARSMEVRRLRLENLHLHQTVAIYELGQTISHTLTLNTMLDKVADIALQQLEADEASVMLVSKDGGELYVAAVRGEGRETLLGQRFPIAAGIAGWVADQREPLVLYGEVSDPRYAPLRPRSDIQSSISYPLLARGKLVGVLNVNCLRRRRTVTLGEIKGLSILASIAASGLEGTLLNSELRDANRQLEETLKKLKETQGHAIQQERLQAMGQMASGIAHDFNNALSVVLGYGDLMLMRPEILRDTEKVKEYLRVITTGAKDAAKVVSRLREFYRKREEAEFFLPLDINSLAKQSVSLTQPKWKDQALASGITIHVETDLQEVPDISGNESELREALTNLIFNAVDAILQKAESSGQEAASGVITIRTVVEPEHVILSVSDTGVGMSEEVRQRCLDPFFSTKGERGTGMGLSMVFGIVTRHEGTMTVESELGKGTSFILHLPLRKEWTSEDLVLESTPVLRPRRVLVVDDESAIRDLMLTYLTGDGHHVETASNGRDGLEKFYAGRFDLVITDRGMPEMNGDQMAAAIRRAAPNKPIIMLTGFGDLMHAADEKPAGVDAILGKPVTLAALRKGMAEVVSQT